MSTRPAHALPADPAAHRRVAVHSLSRFCAAAVATVAAVATASVVVFTPVVVFAPGAAGHLAATVPWQPTDEDLGADSGPDPGTCEAARTCTNIPK